MIFAIGLFVGMTVAFLIKALLEVLIPLKFDLKVGVKNGPGGPCCEDCGKELDELDMIDASRDYLCPQCSADEGLMDKLKEQIRNDSAASPLTPENDEDERD